MLWNICLVTKNTWCSFLFHSSCGKHRFCGLWPCALYILWQDVVKPWCFTACCCGPVWGWGQACLWGQGMTHSTLMLCLLALCSCAQSLDLVQSSNLSHIQSPLPLLLSCRQVLPWTCACNLTASVVLLLILFYTYLHRKNAQGNIQCFYSPQIKLSSYSKVILCNIGITSWNG